VIFGGKNENRDPELIDAEEFIAKKGLQAKGKKTSQYDVKKVHFIEPLHKPEDEIPEPVEEEPVAEVPEAEVPATEPEETPLDIIEPGFGAKLPDIDNIPDIGEIEEPTLF
jgi:topoisomerase-4 subunit A